MYGLLKLDTLDVKTLVLHTKSEKQQLASKSHQRSQAITCFCKPLSPVPGPSSSSFARPEFWTSFCACLSIKRHKDKIKLEEALQFFLDLETELVDRSSLREDPGIMRLISEAKKVKGQVDKLLSGDYLVVANHLPVALWSALVLVSHQPAFGFLFWFFTSLLLACCFSL